MSNQAIDNWITNFVKTQKGKFPKEIITNLTLGVALLHNFKDLPRTDINHYQKRTDLYNAQELANRSCQRLRKQGKLSYHSKRKWESVP